MEQQKKKVWNFRTMPIETDRQWTEHAHGARSPDSYSLNDILANARLTIRQDAEFYKS